MTSSCLNLGSLRLIMLSYDGLDLLGFGHPLEALCFCLFDHRFGLFILKGNLLLFLNNRIGVISGIPRPSGISH